MGNFFKPEILRVPPERKPSDFFKVEKVPEYIPRNITATQRTSGDSLSGSFSLFQDDMSQISLPTAVQSIREQLAGELSREEAAKRKEAARERVREIERKREADRYRVAPEDSGAYADDMALGGVPSSLDTTQVDLTEDITDSQRSSAEEYVVAVNSPVPLPAHRVSPSRQQRPRQR